MYAIRSYYGTFQEQEQAAIHWSTIGVANASDEEIMAWAKENGYIVFTHDLDFGASYNFV